jgi:hypothetical protein
VRKNKREKIESAGVFITPKFHGFTKRTSKSKNTSETGSIQEDDVIPEELWLYILKYLPLTDLVSTLQVNRKFYILAKDNSVWKRHYLSLFYGQKRHVWRMGSLECRWSLSGNIDNPGAVCSSVTHYVEPNDGTKPKHNNKYYERTLARLYYLVTLSIEKFKTSLEPGKSLRYFSEVQRGEMIKDINDRKKIIDARFIWVFKKLYPSKYKK